MVPRSGAGEEKVAMGLPVPLACPLPQQQRGCQQACSGTPNKVALPLLRLQCPGQVSSNPIPVFQAWVLKTVVSPLFCQPILLVNYSWGT